MNPSEIEISGVADFIWLNARLEGRNPGEIETSGVADLGSSPVKLGHHWGSQMWARTRLN